MMPELQNSVFTLQLNPEKGTFSILTQGPKLPDIVNARLGVYFRQQGVSHSELASLWEGGQAGSVTTQSSEHGPVQTISFTAFSGADGVKFELTFGIVQEYPLVVWKVKVLNQSASPINIEKVMLLSIDPGQNDSRVVFPAAKEQGELGFYHNGWQSWSPAGWAAGDGKMPRSRLGKLQHPMIYNAGTPILHKRGQFSSDFFAVLGDRKARTGFVLGFLAQKQQFGSIYADLNGVVRLEMWANCDDVLVEPGKSLETDWAVFNPILLDHRDPMDKYLEAVARENKVNVPAESPVGWCSWYHFYTKVTAADVEANLASIVAGQERLPVQLVQIDDGFETQVGDWFTFKSTFPQGVKPLAEKISREGLIPGLWLAPFIVHTKSELFRNHPDWILRDEKGKPANAGFVWGVLGAALDLTVPAALKYACDVIRTAAKEWGFPYLKLDFLYAAALPGKYHDPTVTRAQVLRRGMEALREAMGAETTLLGCGAPLGPSLGLVEAMRIGPDVSGDWQPTFNGIKAFIKEEPSFPCARNSIHDILTRASLHGRWWINDPDCLLIRPDTHLTLDEVKTLVTSIGMTGGSLLVSDDLPKLPAERLRLAEVLLPVIGERARVLDWFDAEMPSLLRLDLLNDTGEWHLVSRFNWQEKTVHLTLSPQDFDLPVGEYWVDDFWNGKIVHLKEGEAYCVNGVGAHGCVLAAFRRVQDEPQYLGSSLHFSMGKEVADWQLSEAELAFTLRLPRTAEGKVNVALPWEKVTIQCDENLVEYVQPVAGVYQFPVTLNGFAHIRIQKG
jgi:alpha-galactosidase